MLALLILASVVLNVFVRELPSTSWTDDLLEPETGHSRRSAVGNNALQSSQ